LTIYTNQDLTPLQTSQDPPVNSQQSETSQPKTFKERVKHLIFPARFQAGNWRRGGGTNPRKQSAEPVSHPTNAGVPKTAKFGTLLTKPSS